MRHLHHALMVAAVSLVLCAACAPFRGPAEPSGSSSSHEAPTAQPTEAATPDVAQPSLTQALAPEGISGPPMQAGSLYRYFDGALLDAVPDDGPFSMGSGVPGNPQFHVTVSSFWIYSTEVTNQMYAWCVSQDKCSPPDKGANPGFADARYINYPAVGVSWQQASDYCAFAHGRLPTEAEWEKAASWDASANVKRVYPWGDHRPTCDLLNYANCLSGAAPVTSYAQGRSFYGALNMSGNVFEWVADWYSPTYSVASSAKDPTGPASGTQRSVRSSAFGSNGYMVAPTWRSFARPTAQRADLGFRCVVQDPAYFAPYCSMPVFYGATVNAGTGVPEKQCPDPVVEQSAYCGPNSTPVVNVTVHNSPPTLVTISGLDECNPANNDPNVAHQCSLGVKIQVQATCPANPTGSPACPPNYSPDPNDQTKCISIGAAGACPAGFQYDDALKCCSASKGNNSPAPLCAVGQHAYNNMCVDDLTGPQAPASPMLVTNSGLTCTPGTK